MIGKLTGRFGGTTPEGAVLVEVGGVGYVARVPLFALATLREQAFGDVGRQNLAKFLTYIKVPFRTEVPLKRMGGTWSITVAPTK